VIGRVKNELREGLLEKNHEVDFSKRGGSTRIISEKAGLVNIKMRLSPMKGEALLLVEKESVGKTGLDNVPRRNGELEKRGGVYTGNTKKKPDFAEQKNRKERALWGGGRKKGYLEGIKNQAGVEGPSGQLAG